MGAGRRLKVEECGIDGAVDVAFPPEDGGDHLSGFRHGAFAASDQFPDEMLFRIDPQLVRAGAAGRIEAEEEAADFARPHGEHGVASEVRIGGEAVEELEATEELVVDAGEFAAFFAGLWP